VKGKETNVLNRQKGNVSHIAHGFVADEEKRLPEEKESEKERST